jgi:hypothetical protein
MCLEVVQDSHEIGQLLVSDMNVEARGLGSNNNRTKYEVVSLIEATEGDLNGAW